VTVLGEARQRATAFLQGTDYFGELGLGKLSADARMVARLSLELADELEAERSARRAQQERCERLQAIVGKRADDALKGLAR
jgi:hypothetical protein